MIYQKYHARTTIRPTSIDFVYKSSRVIHFDVQSLMQIRQDCLKYVADYPSPNLQLIFLVEKNVERTVIIYKFKNIHSWI